MDDLSYLDEAISLAAEALLDEVGGPFGAVVVRAGEIIGRGRNRVLADRDPTAHAEVEAIRDACKGLQDHDLSGATIYASCEPCPMCLGAIYWARIERIVYAVDRHGAARTGFADADFYDQLALAPEKRRIPAIQILRPEAETVMAAWHDAGGTPY